MEGKGFKPLVSVIIPAYNCGRYIGEAVESALNQADISPEVIVVDDGSTDDTRLVLAPYLDRIRYVYQENQGQSAARNYGLMLSQGQYILFLDADDTLFPGTLAEEVDLLAAQPSLGMIQGGVRLVDERGEMLRDVEPWHNAPRLDLETCVRYKPVQLGAMMIRREWLNRIGGFDSSLRWAEDVDLVLRLALADCEMEWLRRQVLHYRRHDKSITRDAFQEAKHLEIVLDKFFARQEVPDRIRRLEKEVRYYGLVWAARRLYSTGQTHHIAGLLRRSLCYTPYNLTQTLASWMEEFAEELALEGDPAEVGGWVPFCQAAISLDHLPWAQSQMLFRWWIDIWRFYVENDIEEGTWSLEPYHKMKTIELVALARSSLLMTPVDRMTKAVTRFWEDMQTAGLVQESQMCEVVSLYLTAFGQALMAREWAAARCALRCAVRSSTHPRAVSFWLRFFRAALAYVVATQMHGTQRHAQSTSF